MGAQQGLEVDMPIEAGAYMSRGEPGPYDIGKLAGDVIERGGIEALLMGQRQEPDARSQAGAQQTDMPVAPLSQPLNRQSNLDNGATHRLEGKPQNRADHGVGAHHVAGPTLFVVGQSHP